MVKELTLESFLSNVDKTHTLYVVYLEIEKEIIVRIGKLGQFTFPIGTYFYVGSAKRNIAARLTRHLQTDKKFRWHFDYIRPYGKITKIVTYPSQLTECQLREKFQEEVNGSFIIKGFGSSDCKCHSHLIYSNRSYT